MGVGSGAGVLWPPGFENFSKKGCFLSFEWEKQISPILAQPRKNSSDAHGCNANGR